MHDALKRKLFVFFREKEVIFKVGTKYDILDPESQDVIMNGKEIGFVSKIFPFLVFLPRNPYNISVTDPQGKQVVRVSRGISIFLSTVTVHDENDKPIGQFKEKLFSIGGAFRLLDMSGNELAHLKGNWTSRKFSFEDVDGNRLGYVAKKWTGLDPNIYILKVKNSVPMDNPIRQVILAAVVCIDMILFDH